LFNLSNEVSDIDNDELFVNVESIGCDEIASDWNDAFSLFMSDCDDFFIGIVQKSCTESVAKKLKQENDMQI